MPGRTPNEAYRAFVTPLAKALACVAIAKIQASAGGTSVMHRDHHLYLTRQGDGDYVRLKGERGFELRARMVYRLIEDPRPTHGPIRVTTRAYDYSLRLTPARLSSTITGTRVAVHTRSCLTCTSGPPNSAGTE